MQLGDRAAFIGINTRDLDPAPALAFDARSSDLPNLYDPDGELLLGFGQIPPKAIPSTVVIDESAGRGPGTRRGHGKTLVGVVGDVEAASMILIESWAAQPWGRRCSWPSPSQCWRGW